MNDATAKPAICLERPTLANLPALALPVGFLIRSLRVEEGAIWEAVMDQAFGNYEPGDFQKVMVENYDYDPSRVFVMFDPVGTPCATASAWRQHYRWGEGVGYVLFVGVIPAQRGRGLGYQMVLHILHEFVRCGLTSAVLETEDDNLPALKTYLKLGFLPRLVHERQVARWQQIFTACRLAPLPLPTICRPPQNAPHPSPPFPYALQQAMRSPFTGNAR